MIFLAAILATVLYLTYSRSDVIEKSEPAPGAVNPARERMMLGYYAVVAIAAGALLVWAHQQPHAAVAGEGDAPAATTVHLTPAQATSSFPPAEIAKFRTVASDTLAKLNSGDQAAATTRVGDLETAWDDDQATLEPKNEQAWGFLDSEIDQVLTALRDPHPDQAAEVKALDTLLTSLN
ncbi:MULTISPECIES: hypothetical protein [unclassified Streptomyces]|uniref:hypothetical protein n=1 Tax=unclassified Streptomyces TaxID=2593676 RepID=UPI00380ABFBB